MTIRLAATAIAALLVCSSAFAQLLTEKKFFTLPQYTTAGGKTIKNVRVGYETYGKLNAAGDNAVFIAHFFSGTSHAAGRYKADEKAAGYWDAIIGPGKAIDTDKYFVVSADTLANLNVKSPLVGTTGPATLNPDTGKPYGSSFPVVSMKDSVRVHKVLIDSLGIKKLQAVAGASGGSIQAMEWGAEYPQLVERVIHVIGPGLDIHPYVIGLLEIWMMPIKLDPNWKGGDYFGAAEPNEGVAQSLKTVTLTALHFGWAEKCTATSGPPRARARRMRWATCSPSRIRSTSPAWRAPRRPTPRISSGWRRPTSSTTWRRSRRASGRRCCSCRRPRT